MVKRKINFRAAKLTILFKKNIDNPVSSMLHLQQGSTVSDLSNDSSPAHGYPDFPPSPDSWLGTESNNNNNAGNPSTSTTTNSNSANNQSSSHY